VTQRPRRTYFAVKAGETLQAALKEIENPFKALKDKEVALEEMENLFEILEDEEADTEIVIDKLVIGIETPLDMMIIAS